MYPEPDRYLLISGPYRGNGDTNLIYEVCLVSKGSRHASLALCRHHRTAIKRARFERTRLAESLLIYSRFPYDDPVLVPD